MILNKENAFTEQNRFLVYSDQLNATRKQILDTAEEMVSRSAIQTFEDEGETITAIDSSYLASLTIDGKVVQDGTPTPSNPAEIQVVGLNDDNEFGIQIGETLYPIDLQGNVLASLPDGTKDVLTIDSAGHVVLEKYLGYAILDGTETWNIDSSYKKAPYTTKVLSLIKPTASSSVANILCSQAVKASLYQVVNGAGRIAVTSSGRVYLNLANSEITAQQQADLLTSSPATIVYMLKTAQTIDLGYISMPEIPDGAAISITAEVTPTIAAKWWTKNQSDVATAFGAVSSDLAALQGEISALDVRVTALESANTRTLVLENPEATRETADASEEIEEQEEMTFEDSEE